VTLHGVVSPELKVMEYRCDLTHAQRRQVTTADNSSTLQGYLAHKKPPHPLVPP